VSDGEPSRPVHPLVAALVKKVDYNGGQPLLNEVAFDLCLQELGNCKEAEREAVATDLVAIALEFRAAGQSCEDLFIQLCFLAYLANENLTQQLLAARGVSADGARALLAQHHSKLPVPKGKTSDDNSVFSALLDSRRRG
jgi:hypothetical protein